MVRILWISKAFGTRSASDSGVFRFFKYLHRFYWLGISNPQDQTPTSSYINQEVGAYSLDNEESIPLFVFGLGSIYKHQALQILHIISVLMVSQLQTILVLLVQFFCLRKVKSGEFKVTCEMSHI